MKKKVMLMMVPAVMLSLASCKKKETPDSPVVPETITLDRDILSLSVGVHDTLSVTFSPENSTETALAWISDKEAVATVNENGKVTGVAEGTATITVSSVSNPNAKATCKVKVFPKIDPAPKPDILALENFKTVMSGTYPNNTAIKTDNVSGNVWLLYFKTAGTPVMKCFDKNFNDITGDWKELTTKECPGQLPTSDFDILPDGSAICAYAQKTADKIFNGYYTVIRPDGTIVNGDGTLVYDIREDFPSIDHSKPESHVVADGNGGAWIALSYDDIVVVRHYLPTGELDGNAVKIKPGDPEAYAMNLNMMPAKDGGVFITEMEMKDVRKKEEHTAHWMGHGNLIKIESDCKSYTIKAINTDTDCNPSNQMNVVSDTQGGGYVAYRTQSGNFEVAYCAHFDGNGNVGTFKPVMRSAKYEGFDFAVNPSDQSLYFAVIELVEELQHNIWVVIGHKISLTSVDMAGNVQLNGLTIREFDSPAAKPVNVEIFARKGKVMDVCYLFHDLKNPSPYYRFGVGSFSEGKIYSEIATADLSIDKAVIERTGGSKGYFDNRLNLGWQSSATSEICVGQIVLK